MIEKILTLFAERRLAVCTKERVQFVNDLSAAGYNSHYPCSISRNLYDISRQCDGQLEDTLRYPVAKWVAQLCNFFESNHILYRFRTIRCPEDARRRPLPGDNTLFHIFARSQRRIRQHPKYAPPIIGIRRSMITSGSWNWGRHSSYQVRQLE